MSELVDPFTGELLDSPRGARRHGDSNPNASNRANPRRWGSQVLVSNIQNVGRPNPTVIDTHDLGLPIPIDVEMRFASNLPNNNPNLPFTFGWVSATSQLRVEVKRGIDPTAGLTPDIYTLDQPGDVLPFDIIQCRNLVMNVSITGSPISLWVQTLATPVHNIGTRATIPGWGRTRKVFANANVASVLLLNDNPGRSQFIVVNTSTNANLFLCFGTPATIGSASIVLPPNQYATYESPVGGYSGIVTGIWDTAAPNGQALVTEGLYR